MADKIILRNDIVTNWTNINPILSSSEIGVENDTDKFKVGDGITAWNSLLYSNNIKTLNGSGGALVTESPTNSGRWNINVTGTGGDMLQANYANGISQPFASINPVDRAIHADNAAISVKEFGAVGDGIADDTLAIQSANGAINGGTIYFPVGTYNISSQINITKGNSLRLEPNAILKATAAMENVISWGDTLYYIKPSIIGGQIDGNGLANTCLLIKMFRGFILSDMECRNAILKDYSISPNNDGYELICDRCRAINTITTNITNNYGFYIGTSDCHFNDCITTECTTGFWANKGAHFVNCHVWNTQSARLNSTVGFDLHNSHCVGCFADTCSIGWYIRTTTVLINPIFIVNPSYVPSTLTVIKRDGTPMATVIGGQLNGIVGVTSTLFDANLHRSTKLIGNQYYALSDVGTSDDEMLNDGWTYIQATFATSSLAAPHFAIGQSAFTDLSTFLKEGYKLKLTQDGITKYFITTNLVPTVNPITIGMYGGTDNVLTNSAITDVAYSMLKNPRGFNTDPAKWTIEVTDTNLQSVLAPGQNVWYNVGGSPIQLPVVAGAWYLKYKVFAYSTYTSGDPDINVTLSTANSTEYDPRLTCHGDGGGNSQFMSSVQATAEIPINISALTTFYLNAAQKAQMSCTGLYFANNLSKMYIRAVCAYL